MELILMIVVALEMTCVNLYVSYICFKKKYSAIVTWMALLVFTAGLFFVMMLIKQKIPHSGDGNGLIMLIGFLYLVPFRFLYAQTPKYTLAVICSSWIYTMFAFSLSVRAGYLLDRQWFGITVVLFQTILYILTLPVFLRFVKNRFVGIIQNIGDNTLNLLLQFGLLWFITAVLMNYIFVAGGSAILKLISALFFMLSSVLSFKLFYSLVVVSKTATKLTEQTRTDQLTKLRNRYELADDVQKMIANGTHFSIIFIDLDNFKFVNDEHGHAAGDAYLIEFADAAQQVLNECGRLYRMSGDEFVFLYEGLCTNDFLKSMEHNISSICKKKIKFQGMSSGYALFPKDGDDLSTLLKIADFNMYQKKKFKHKRFL